MKSGLNATYISSSLREKLEVIPDYLVTTIVAAAGYGKTRAIRFWIENCSSEDDVVLSMTVLRDSLSEFWSAFIACFDKWSDTRSALKALGFPMDDVSRDIMRDILKSLFDELDSKNIYFVIEDLNFISDPLVLNMIMGMIADFDNIHAPYTVRFILASRNVIFNHAEIIKLGADLNEITMKDLTLNTEDIMLYSQMGGIELKNEDAAMLQRTTEGWFSVVYLNLSSWQRNHMWLNGSDSIYTIMDEVLFEPLTKREADFLVAMSLPDEFTQEEAWRIWQEDDAREILSKLSTNNAFITRLPNGKYRYHNMLKKCATVKFNSFPEERKKQIYLRLAKWYERDKKLPLAELYYYKCGAWDELLECFLLGQGRTVIGENVDRFLQWEKECPEAALLRHPVAPLICMKVLFSFGQFEEMFRVKRLLDDFLSRDDIDITEAEKNNLLGESELIMGFTVYNDIHAMSSFHRRASELMTRYALNTDPKGSWTFGSPSVLWMFHRTPGGLDSENEAMFECMPYYYKCTNFHGNGAEYAMLSEIYFMRGDLIKAEQNAKLAIASAKLKGQLSIQIAAVFVLCNILMLGKNVSAARAKIAQLRENVIDENQFNLVYTMDMVEAWIEALNNSPGDVTLWIIDESIPTQLPRPSLPMLAIIRNQVKLSKGDYAGVIAGRIPAEKTCEALHACLCSIYLYLQLAAANEKIGQKNEAISFLKKAIDLAKPDDIMMPFSMFYKAYLTESFEALSGQEEYAEFIEAAKRLSERSMNAGTSAPITDSDKLRKPVLDDLKEKLTERELMIARLAAERKTNKEIAKELYLAEGTVRNQLSNVFNKLDIEGDTRNKRLELEKLFH